MRRTIQIPMLLATLCLLGSCKGDAEDYGYVRLQLTRGDASMVDPFMGTSGIDATIAYDGGGGSPCLVPFYNEHPDEQFEGPAGAEAKAEWMDRLCSTNSPGEGDELPCSVVDIEQTLSDDADPSVLKVTYSVSSGNINDHVLLLGPLPTAKKAGCTWVVRITGAFGTDSSGNRVWHAATFPDATAGPGQVAPMVITAQAS